jgi:hypothetical protein
MIPKVAPDAALIVSAVILPVSLIPPIRIYPLWQMASWCQAGIHCRSNRPSAPSISLHEPEHAGD